MSSSRSADASSDPVPVTSPWHSRALAAGLCQAAADEIPSLPSLPSTLHRCHLSPCPAPIQVSQPAAGIPKKTLRKPSCPLNPSLSCLGNTQTASTPRNQHLPAQPSASHGKTAAGCAVWYLWGQHPAAASRGAGIGSSGKKKPWMDSTF